MTLAINVAGLRKSFGDTLVLDGIDLTVAEGTVFSLLGPNGAGKTTTVEILSTVIPADAGRIEVAGHDLTRDPARVSTLLEQFKLSDAAGRPASTYSGGMQRRLDLAMTLMGDPRLIFLDEPTTGLDPRSRRTMWPIVRGLLVRGHRRSQLPVGEKPLPPPPGPLIH